MTAETETMRDVMAEPVEIRGSLFVATRPRGHVTGSGNDYFLGGGFVIGIRRYTTGTAEVELRECGIDTPLLAGSFDSYAEARAEFDRLKAQLEERAAVEFAAGLADCGVLPAEFVPAVRSGDFGSLAVAADYRDDRGETDNALLLRAAYHRLLGEANVAVKATKKTTVIYNPQYVSRKHGVSKGGVLAAVVVTPGESVRIVSLVRRARLVGTPGAYRNEMYDEVMVKEFRIGQQAEYDSFNLVYFAPIKSITAKSVVISGKYSGSRDHRLDMATFVSKNHDFDLAAAQKRNSEHMD